MTDHNDAATMDDDIEHLAKTKEKITAIENGEKDVLDKESELDGLWMVYNENFTEAVVSDEITDIEVIENPEGKWSDHPVRAETDRFDIIGKFGDEKHDTTDEVIFVMIEHPETELTYTEVNGAIGEKVTAALDD